MPDAHAASLTPQDAPSSMPDAAIDLATIDRLFAAIGADGDDLRRGLIETFLANAEQRLRAMRSASDHDDAPAAELPAHSLKSSSAMMGAIALSSVCAEIEAASRSGMAGSSLCQLVAMAEVEFRRVAEALHGVLRAAA